MIRVQLGFIAAILLIAAFIGYGLLRYPLVVSEMGFSSVLAPALMLLLYAGVAVWWFYRPGLERNKALKSTQGYGLAIGVILIVSIALENFVSMNSQVSTISTLASMFMIFILFSISGWRGTQASGTIRFGVFAAIWSSMVGVLIALIFGFSINFLFEHRLEQNLRTSAEFVRSASHDLATFTFWNTLDSATSHLFEAPILAAGFGALGSWLSLRAGQIRIFKHHKNGS